MAQAITGHSSALAGRSISYYSMKLTFSLQTSVLLPQRGRPARCFERGKESVERRGSEEWREVKREGYSQLGKRREDWDNNRERGKRANLESLVLWTYLEAGTSST